MDRVNKILADRDFISNLSLTEQKELHRPYCKHCFDHLLAVARLAYILLLEEGLSPINKETVYAAGLLHDFGRGEQYLTGADHAVHGAELAAPLLNRAGFSEHETLLISEAISQHRHDAIENIKRSPLSRALNKADRLSRLCFYCKTKNSCITIERQPHKERLIY